MTVVLLSGGIDSAVVLALTRRAPWVERGTIALGVDYGQPHVRELQFARDLAERFGVEYVQFSAPPMPLIDDVVFAGRNALLVSMGVSLAMSRGHDAVAIGCNFTDAARFPDCRPGFFKGLSAAMRYAYDVTVAAPLLDKTKHQVVALGRELGVPVEQTWSCYSPADRPCGACMACIVRAEAGA
jgi:7-cyano-7-deazaguanine synthase